MSGLPFFSEDPIYRKADRYEFVAHGQIFDLCELSIGFVSHRLLRDQFEDWLASKGRYIAILDETETNDRRLRDLAWHIWFRARPANNVARSCRRIDRPPWGNPLRYRDLQTEDLKPLFETSTFWMAERLDFARDWGHVWKTLISPLHIARTRSDIERLIIEDIPSPWQSVMIADVCAPNLPSRKPFGSSAAS